MRRRCKHVWELIQELDAWQQHGIQFGIEMDIACVPRVQIFERARNMLDEAFPAALASYKESGKAHSAEVEAERLGARVLARATSKHEPHLEFVLCECGGYQPYVSWYLNKECGGFHGGIYCATLAEALEAHEGRMKRANGERIALVD